MVFFLSVFYTFVASSYSIAKHLSPLIRLLKVYDRLYSVSFDCENFYRKIKRAVSLSFIGEFGLAVLVVAAFHTIFPSFKKHLSPFDHLSGASLYFVSILFGYIICVHVNTMSCIFIFLKSQTFILRKEFGVVNKQFKALFGSREDFILNASDQTIFNLSDPHGARTRPDKLSQASHPHTHHSCTSDDESERQMLFSSCTQTGARPSRVPEEHPQVDRLESGRETRLQSTRKEGGHPHPQQSHHKPPSYEWKGSCNVNHPTHAATRHTDGDPANQHSGRCRVTTEHDTDHMLEDLMNARLLHSVGGSDCEKQTPHTMSDSHEEDAEDVFDRLHLQHQTLAVIVHHVRGCAVHLLAISFISGIPQFCLVIYGLGSSSVGVDESLFLTFIITHQVAAMVTCILLGTVIRENASEPQDIIYGADWSKMPHTLLCKAQMLCTQLSDSHLAFDVYGLFSIDRSTVLMVVGTLATYTVVVIQFQVGTITDCSTANNSNVSA
ncbi:uncharacterized protein LOC143288915 [Babylonia areolata]|uniref:uncharacterized protein LOC143288915 n=1 Tax=Babylonia areolata TaxID=304850 RepID=UPI003FD6ACA8